MREISLERSPRNLEVSSIVLVGFLFISKTKLEGWLAQRTHLTTLIMGFGGFTFTLSIWRRDYIVILQKFMSRSRET